MQELRDILADPELRTALLALPLGLLVSSILVVLVHEAGHALFGHLAGSRIRLIRIGRGPVLFHLHIGLSLLVWRLFPVSGAVATYRPLVSVRRARLILIAGGACANALFAAGLASLLPWPPDPVLHPVLAQVLIVQASGILNLLFVVGSGRPGTTDGGLFRAALRQPSSRTDALLARLYQKRVIDRAPALPIEPPSALAAVVLHALVIGTPEATYTELEAVGTERAARECVRLRERLLITSGLTARERDALRHAQSGTIAHHDHGDAEASPETIAPSPSGKGEQA